MKVALLAEYPLRPDRPHGGIEELTRRFASALARQSGAEVHVVSFHGSVPDGPNPVVHDGVTIHRGEHPTKFGNLTFRYAERRRTADVIRRLAPDVIHAFGIGAKALAAADTGIPWVPTVNGFQTNEARDAGGLKNYLRMQVFRRLEDESLRRAKTIIVPNPVVKEMLGRRGDHAKLLVIENAVDRRFFDMPAVDPADPAARPVTRIVCVGRLLTHKRPENLIDAVARLGPAGKDLHVRWVGPPDRPGYLEALRERVRANGLEGRFDFLGFVSDDELYAEVEAAGLLVHPSAVEVAPLAVMQGMAAGLPVLATDVGGTRYQVRDRETGRLVPKDDVPALAEALQWLISDPARAAALGAAGRREAAERFRLERTVEKTLEAYEIALAAR
ncbi:MAG: glycosyltransferase family 4 protein [bacterium]